MVSTKKYLLGVVILLSLPLLISLRLLIMGERANGTVVGQGKVSSKGSRYGGSYTYSVIKFVSKEQREYGLRGPLNITYSYGTILEVYYNKSDPNDNMVFSFLDIYLSSKSYLSGILLLVWGGVFYAGRIEKKEKMV